MKPFKIVALDTYTTDFDGLEWSEMSSLGEFVKYPRTAPEQVIERAQGFQAVIINKIDFNQSVFSQLPELCYVGETATGTDDIDLQTARERGIAVTNVPGYSTHSVSQLVFAFLLDYCSKVSHYNYLVKKGAWTQSKDFCFLDTPLSELAGKKLGIIGFGSIGRSVAEIGKALGMEILVAALPGRAYTEKRLPLEEVLSKADAVSLHCPLTEQTKNLIDAEKLSLMKPSAVLINTARGALVNEAALAAALAQGTIAHACTDVLSSEPPSENNPLFSAPNITITPHVAWSTREARERLVHETTENLRAFIEGKKRNRVES